MRDDRVSVEELLNGIGEFVDYDTLFNMVRESEFAAKLAMFGVKTLEESWRKEAKYLDHRLGDGFEEWFKAVTRDIPEEFSRREVRSMFGNDMRKVYEERKKGAIGD